VTICQIAAYVQEKHVLSNTFGFENSYRAHCSIGPGLCSSVLLPNNTELRGQISMRQIHRLLLSTLASALLAGTALAADPQDATSTAGADEADATVDLTGGSVAVGVGYVWGNGDLVYKGQKHQFKLSGVSIVDVGAAHIAASGVVYHLKNISDFDGNYTAVTAGITVAGGGSAALLKNQHGVVIKLLSTTEGLRFNLSANGIDIKLKG
jgi:hypothetical protein